MDDFFDKVRKHADKAKDEAEKLTRRMMDKTNNVITQTKLNFAINETEGKIKEIYAQMGERVYDKHTGGADVYEELEEYCEKIDELFEEVRALREKLAEVKDTVTCPSCGEQNPKTSSYCGKCGSSLTKAEKAKEYGTVYAEAEPVKPEETDETEGEE